MYLLNSGTEQESGKMYTLAASSFCRKHSLPAFKLDENLQFQRHSVTSHLCMHSSHRGKSNVKIYFCSLAITGRHDLHNSKVSQIKLLKKYNFNNSQFFVRISEESTEWCLPFRFTRPRFSRNEISSGNLWNGRKNTFMKSLCLQIL